MWKIIDTAVAHERFHSDHTAIPQNRELVQIPRNESPPQAKID